MKTARESAEELIKEVLNIARMGGISTTAEFEKVITNVAIDAFMLGFSEGITAAANRIGHEPAINAFAFEQMIRELLPK